jgi:potassium channel subfamily K
MADNSIQEALLPDAPNVLASQTSEGDIRFQRCRLIRLSSDKKPTEPAGPSLQPFKKRGPNFRLVGLILLLYLLAGVIIFYLVMDQMSGMRTNRVLDALYLVIVTMTSVGCGDLVPNSDTTKLLACAFVFTGMAIVGIFISKLADYLVEKQEVFFKAPQGEAKMLSAVDTNKIKYKF